MVSRQLLTPESRVFYFQGKMTFDNFCSEFFGVPLSLSIYQWSELTDLSITDAICRNNWQRH